MSLALLLALVLPALMGLLPPLAPTAAYALDRDITAGRCAEQREGGQAPSHGDHKPCCILCPPGTALGAEAEELHGLAPDRAGGTIRHFAASPVPVIRPARTGLSARGPPAGLIAANQII